jgi:hypothetical protein
MAYVSQDLKAKLAPQIKAVLKKYGIKGTISVRHHSTLVLNIKSGPIDFITNSNDTVSQQPGGFRNGSPSKDYISINPYWYHEHFSGNAKEFLTEVLAAMKEGNWDHSDIQSDYFNVGWYVDVNIGNWQKPYIVEA